MQHKFFHQGDPLGKDMAVRMENPYDWVESSVDGKNRTDRIFLGVTISRRTRLISFIAILGILCLFFARSVQLQVVQGSGFSLLSQNNQVRTYNIPAKRGTFRDMRGVRLVSNAAAFVVRLHTNEIPKESNAREKFEKDISEILHLSREDIAQMIEVGRETGSSVVLKDQLLRDDALGISVAIADMKGVTLDTEEVRRYEFDGAKSLSHIIGYTGRITKEEFKNRHGYELHDIVGKEGLEDFYEGDLRGIFGKRKVEVDALGIERGVIEEEKAQDGNSILLTIDLQAQKKAEEILRSVLSTFHTRRGVCIVSDPRTGAIIALVSLPSYDNNLFSYGISKKEYTQLLNDPEVPLFPRATRGEYPSGSTIKMIVAAAGLQEKVVTPSTSILSNGGIRIGEWFFPDWKAGGHGRTNLTKALAESVNTYFYTIGGGYQSFQGLGIERIITYFKKFGLGEATGIDLFHESTGFVPSPEWKQSQKGEPWYIGDTYHVSIGQGDILVTPLQVHLYTEYFANKGISYHPHLISQILPPGDLSIGKLTEPQIYKKDILDSEVVEKVREGLREGVLAGSARRLGGLPATSAGKTGTAQWQKGKRPHAWFTGWAPYENPEVLITVLVEEGEEGSRSAIQVAYEFLSWYFSKNSSNSIHLSNATSSPLTTTD